MSNRVYRLIFGVLLLIGLYIESFSIVYALIFITALEALTNQRLPKLICKMRYGHDGDACEDTLGLDFTVRTTFEAERGWRLTVACMLMISLLTFPYYLWWLPWFMGFAILGAGVSGVCPMYLGLKWIGLR